MPADSSHPPAEQRVLAAVYTAAGCALMLLLVWQHLDAGGPQRAFESAREKVGDWRRNRRELLETLEQIEDLPETEEASCEER